MEYRIAVTMKNNVYKFPSEIAGWLNSLPGLPIPHISNGETKMVKIVRVVTFQVVSEDKTVIALVDAEGLL